MESRRTKTIDTNGSAKEIATDKEDQVCGIGKEKVKQAHVAMLSLVKPACRSWVP